MPYRHLTLITLAAFALGLWAGTRRNQRNAHVEPEELQTWEGEGGGLPNGGPGRRPVKAAAGSDAHGAADATP